MNLHGTDINDFNQFLLTSVFDIPVHIFVVDVAAARIIYANKHMIDTLGEECVGRQFSEQFGGAGGRHFFVSYNQSTPLDDSQEFPLQSEYFDDETENWYHVLQRSITWLDGSQKMVCMLNEIDSLKKLQSDLSEAHALLAIKSKDLEKAVKTDHLTKLNNRHHLDQVLEQELSRSRRTLKPFSIFIADCDKFKSVNDTYGHQVGDLVLIDIAGLLTSSLRKTDTVGRWGGEEFLAILPETGLSGARLVAEEVRRSIEAHDFAIVGHKTVSLGVAELRQEESIKELITRADEALYLAKENGRNRVEVIT